MLFIYLQVLFLFCTISLEYPTGSDFIEKFVSFDQSFWKKEDGYLVCPGSCVYMKEDQLRFFYFPADKDQKHPMSMLQFSMASNCKQDYCCDQYLTTCAHYTGSVLSSLKSFGYGSFTFVVKASWLADGDACYDAPGWTDGTNGCDVYEQMTPNGPNSGWCAEYGQRDITGTGKAKDKCCICGGGTVKEIQFPSETHAAASCFSIGRTYKEFYEELPMGVSICIPSKNPWEVKLTIQYGTEATRFTKVIPLGFDSSEHSAYYRLDWHPDHVSFRVNGKLKHMFKQTRELYIPDNPLFIKAMLVPELPTRFVERPKNKPTAVFRMYLFEVKYKSYKVYTTPPKEELFVDDRSHVYRFETVFFISTLVICPVMMLCTLGRFLHFDSLRAQYYEGLDQE